MLKVKFFTQSPTKTFCINVFKVGGYLASCVTFTHQNFLHNVFKVGGYLASCLTFRPFLTFLTTIFDV